jgi:hypothetical protein
MTGPEGVPVEVFKKLWKEGDVTVHTPASSSGQGGTPGVLDGRGDA